MDLLKQIIHVYDSTQSVVMKNKDLIKECRIFTTMIHLLLNEMVPAKAEEKKFTSFQDFKT